jgi:heptosyltransferase-2
MVTGFKKNHRILVIKNRDIGDTILMTGPLRVLSQQRPNYSIDVLVRAPAGQLLEGLPYIDRVISATEPENKFRLAAYWIRLMHRLREKRYDMVINFHASVRTSVTSRLLRAGVWINNNHELNGKNLFSDLPVPGRGIVKSNIDRDLDALRAIGVHANPADALPEISLSKEESDAAERLLEDTPFENRIFLGIGGSRATKRWLPEHFADFAEQLTSKKDASFIITAVDSDEPWLSSFLNIIENRQGLKSKFKIFKNLPLVRVAGIINRCKAYVGNDSGLKHLAAALKLRTFTFFGPEIPLEWHPYPEEMHPYFFIKDLPCRTESGKHFCSITTCDKHGHKCMKNIEPTFVTQEVLKLLQC